MFTWKQIEQFKLKLHKFDWAKILALEDSNKAYDDFLTFFQHIGMKVFLKLKLNWREKIFCFLR